MSTPGIIAIDSVPWPPAPGCMETARAALVAANIPGAIFVDPLGIHCPDVPIVSNILTTYVGSSDELKWTKAQKQSQLDTNLEENFNLISFIRNGTLTPVTGTQVGNFLAGECSNYRTLRAQIAAATTVAQVNAIDVNSGWPNNP